MQADELLHFQQACLQTLTKGGGLRDLALYIAAVFKRDVLITNFSHRILVSTISHDTLQEGRFLMVPPSTSLYGRVTVFAGEQEVNALALELNHANQRFGFLLICDAGSDEDERILSLAKQAILPCVLEFQKQESLLESKRHFRDVFLFDLLYGNIQDEADIIAQGKLWDWDFQLPHIVTVMELEAFEPYSEDPELLKKLCDIVDNGIRYQDKKAIVMQKNEEVVLILPGENRGRHGNKVFLNMIMNQILAQAEELLSPRIVRVGVGREYDHCNELFRSYQEAKVALELGRLLQEQNHIPFFADLGMARILYNHDRQELLEFYQETLGDLERYDKAQKNELMATLEKYISYHCDLKKTANSLFIHPNTLRYRLKRIEDILEINTEDFDTILSLWVAFKIKHIIKL